MQLRSLFVYIVLFGAVAGIGSLPHGAYFGPAVEQELATKQIQSQGGGDSFGEQGNLYPTVNLVTETVVDPDTSLLTIEQQKASLLEALTYANSLLLLSDELTVDREYVLKSIDKVYDSLSDRTKAITTDGSLTRPVLSEATLIDGVIVDGTLELEDVSPSLITSRLYNTGGDLYWNGSILNSSTTNVWSTATGDAFRLTGNVGIGTTTPTQELTVVGGGLFTESLIAPILDTGGQVCNVEAYGAVGDNSTINDVAIARAIAECPVGEAIYFPMGEFRISTPIVLDRPVTFRGAYSPRWSYSSTPRSSIRADFGSFAGVALIHVRDRSISGEPNDNNGGRIEYMSLDGGSAGTNVDGIYFEGLVRDWKLTDVDISQVTGNGFEAAVGTGSGNPRGFTIRGLSIYSADGHGFRATALNDTYIDDLLAVGNSLRGIYLSSMGETKIANSRAVFNGLTGLYIDGASANGGISFTDFSTDRNDRHGVRISSTGTSTIIFNGLLTRRDGPNTSGGSETPYAGLAIIGSSTAKVAPVFVSGLGQTVGVDDFDNPPLSPLTGVRVSNAEYVKLDGQLWGVNESWRDDGGNEFFIIEDDAILKTGTAGAQELFTNARKWQSTSTDELIFGNTVSIGSSTDSRLFNIVAPSQVAARMRDTTNDVTMDMRVEDFQAFIGTFTNHQMRFQTNNTSRLTIDIDGDIGIGTTSPDSELDVDGTIQATNLLGGATTLSTDANGNIIRNPSDERLKENIQTIDGALDQVLALRGVTYNWLDTDRFGDQLEVGFIAQEVDAVVPEAVQKGGEYWSLNTANLVAVVVEAIQDMWQGMTGLQAQVDAQNERIETLEALLEVQVVEETREEAEPEDEEESLESDPLPEIEVPDTATTTIEENVEPEEVEEQEVAEGLEEIEEAESIEESASEESEPTLNELQEAAVETAS